MIKRKKRKSDKENFFSQNFGSQYQRYVDLLTSHEQTYAFFNFLHDRFNGDIFPIDEEEKKIIRPENLEMLQRLFTEEVVGDKSHRQKIFFWAYNFEFVPIELISSIYEEFLHEEEDGKLFFLIHQLIESAERKRVDGRQLDGDGITGAMGAIDEIHLSENRVRFERSEDLRAEGSVFADLDAPAADDIEVHRTIFFAEDVAALGQLFDFREF